MISSLMFKFLGTSQIKKFKLLLRACLVVEFKKKKIGAHKKFLVQLITFKKNCYVIIFSFFILQTIFEKMPLLVFVLKIPRVI